MEIIDVWIQKTNLLDLSLSCVLPYPHSIGSNNIYDKLFEISTFRIPKSSYSQAVHAKLEDKKIRFPRVQANQQRFTIRTNRQCFLLKLAPRLSDPRQIRLSSLLWSFHMAIPYRSLTAFTANTFIDMFISAQEISIFIKSLVTTKITAPDKISMVILKNFNLVKLFTSCLKQKCALSLWKMLDASTDWKKRLSLHPCYQPPS